MGERLFIRAAGHPACALVCALVFALVAAVLVRGGVAARDRLTAADDPVKISDRALDRTFNRDVAQRGISAALASGDLDLAQSFVALAADRNLAIDPALAAKVEDASAQQSSVANTAGRFVHGLWTGEPSDLASLAGTATGDLFVFGDIRDAAREGTRYLMGERYDPWILGLAGVGIAVTAVTYATAGVTAPERVGLSLVKAARRSGKLNPVLAVRAAREVVKVEEAGGLVALAENTGRIEAKAGTQAAMDSLAVAEEPQDMSRLAQLSAAKGGKTRAIVKLLGRAAIVLTATTFNLAMWLIWAAFAIFGFCASCKTAVERMTQRVLLHNKARRLREAESQMLALPAQP
jgi:hypothetical protein